MIVLREVLNGIEWEIDVNTDTYGNSVILRANRSVVQSMYTTLTERVKVTGHTNRKPPIIIMREYLRICLENM